MGYSIAYSCISHIGRIRSMNQDNYFCDGQFRTEKMPPNTELICGVKYASETPVFAVFDGMGGEECGEVASQIASETAAEFNWKGNGILALGNFCTKANEAICDYTANHDITSMGTTAAMLLFNKRNVLLCNIGDSRIFQITPTEFKQISTDHVSIAVFGRKPPLSQNLGIPPEEMLIEPYISRGDYSHGDKYLICSDGVTDMVTEEEIEAIIRENSVEEAARLLLDRSLQNGGRDNTTLILLEVRKTGFFARRKKKPEAGA